MKNPILCTLVLLCVITLTFGRSPYKVVSTQSTTSTIVLGLRYTGQDEYYIKPTSPILKDLTFTLTVYTFNDFDFKITDAKRNRF
jgi:hypothetical protein